MSVNYDLYETPDLAKSGEEQPLHARVVLKGSYTAEEFVEQVTVLQHMPHAQVVGIIEAISKELRHLLLKGFSIELGDIGYFSGSSSNLVVISFLFHRSSSFLILLKVVDMFAF